MSVLILLESHATKMIAKVNQALKCKTLGGVVVKTNGNTVKELERE